MKVDSKSIVPFIDTLKTLLDDYGQGFAEMEDVEQCKEVFLYVQEQINTVIASFKVDHLTAPVKDRPAVPGFVLASEMIETGDQLSSSEERDYFMSRLYFDIKRKLVTDGVDHLTERNRIQHHIEVYLVRSDGKWAYYFDTALERSAYKVIDTVVDEIIEARKKNPQFTLDLEAPALNKKKTLIDLLGSED